MELDRFNEIGLVRIKKETFFYNQIWQIRKHLFALTSSDLLKLEVLNFVIKEENSRSTLTNFRERCDQYKRIVCILLLKIAGRIVFFRIWLTFALQLASFLSIVWCRRNVQKRIASYELNDLKDI